MLLASGVNAPSLVSRMLSTRPFVKVGDVSYSWYLWHWPVIVLGAQLWSSEMAKPVFAIASIAPAVLAYHYVERPIHIGQVPSGFAKIRLLLAATLPALLLTSAVITAASNGFWIPQVRKYTSSVLPPHAGDAAGCSTNTRGKMRDITDCWWNKGLAGSPVYLLGDSNADHFSEGVIDASSRLGRPAAVWRWTPCQDASSPVPYLQPGSTVIIASTDHYYKDGPGSDCTAILETLVRDLQAKDERVVLIQTVPYLTWQP